MNYKKAFWIGMYLIILAIGASIVGHIESADFVYLWGLIIGIMATSALREKDSE